ncbi:hypothetical protein D9Q98_007406 [Chlorella vulgaris]|uniref:Uncharacterized protein n=1 Tax=Chlorella vulgaris TaxID=3077 RepID=A0A9D4TLD1_CHLVU|nr:hypothetical protein D9Q98_007406 [Chlorella vulgaris]
MAGCAAVTAVNGVPASATGYQWWTVWFQFFTLIYSIVVAVRMPSIHAARLRTYLLLMVTVQWTIVANSSRVDVDTSSGDLHSASGALLAGAILTLIVNFLLIIYWGLTDHGTASMGVHGETAAPRPGTAAPASPFPKAEPTSPATPVAV